MNAYMMYGLNGLLAAIIASGGVVLSSVVDHGGAISEATWVIAAVTGLVSFAKDVQSHMKFPPA